MKSITHRSPLGSIAISSIGAALLFYLLVIFVLRPEAGALHDSPFAVCAGTGFVMFLVLYLFVHRARGIRVDQRGLFDIKSRVRIDWEEIEEVKIDTEPVPERGATLYIATITAGERTIRFASFESALPKTPTATDLSQSAVLLATIAAQSGSEALFPESWTVAQAEPLPQEAPAGQGKLRRGQGAGIFALLLKLGPKLLKVGASLLKTIKPGAAILTVGAYALIFNWTFAVALFVMIGVHECGHVYAMWRCGIPVKGIYFVPFFGGLAVGRGAAKTRWQNGYIAIAGPIWGAALAALCALVYLVTDAPLWGAFAAWGALINLFNLLPILPLDGGRILSQLGYSSRSWGAPLTFASLLLGGIIAYWADLQLLVLMVGIGAMEFGGQLGSRPLGPSIRMLGSRPYTDVEQQHFERLVVPRYEKPQLQRQMSEQRRARFANELSEASQTPMDAKQIAILALGYLALAGALLGLMYWLRQLPGGGNPLQMLM